MDVKKAVLLVGALVIAVAAALMARSMFSGGGSAPQATAAAVPQQQLDGPKVLVATKALPVGTIIDAESFRFQPWPKDLIETAYYLEGKADPTALQGSVVRVAITAGQPVTQGALIKPGERGFLAAALGAGMRAVTVPVSAQSSVAGFIFPGDHVDLMVTQTINGDEEADNPLKVSETIVRNLRVLATDQRTNALDDSGKPEVRTYSNVTLEVTPRIAEKIAVAQTLGQLSLSLRSLADTRQELDAAIADGTVDLPDGSDPAAEKRALTQIMSRPEADRRSYSTGADVSRFARRTMPARKPVEYQPPKGPVIRVARGASVAEVEIKGK